MTRVIAHRGAWSSSTIENSAEAVRKAVEKQFWLEVDVRASRDKVLVLSHDPVLAGAGRLPVLIREQESVALESLCSLEWLVNSTSGVNTTVFLHVKELDLVAEVCGVLEDHAAFGNCVLFADGEDTWKLLEFCNAHCPKARKALHARSAIECTATGALLVDALWVDEQAGPWFSAGLVSDWRSRGCTVCAVSPEVWRPGVGRAAVLRAWEDWIAWGVDAICTDMFLDLHRFTREGNQEETT